VEYTAHAPGTFCWLDLSTGDAAGAKEYYAGLFGWQATDVPAGPDMVYSLLNLNGKGVGALYQETRPGIPPHWSSYISVADVDATAARAKELGGTLLVEPMDVMEHGRMCVVQDPGGATFCCWQSKAHHGVDVKDEIGTVCWFELDTRDTAQAEAFYTALFGWGVKHSMEGYTEFTVGGESIAGMMAITPDMGAVPPHWLPYFLVQNCDGSVAKAAGLGAIVIVPGMDVPGVGRFAVLQDPQGAVSAIISM
jgi:predicted enzyme related to lactoylglutathione lyase